MLSNVCPVQFLTASFTCCNDQVLSTGAAIASGGAVCSGGASAPESKCPVPGASGCSGCSGTESGPMPLNCSHESPKFSHHVFSCACSALSANKFSHPLAVYVWSTIF